MALLIITLFVIFMFIFFVITDWTKNRREEASKTDQTPFHKQGFEKLQTFSGDRDTSNMTAFFLSLLFSGMGQIYQKKVMQGLAFTISTALMYILGLWPLAILIQIGSAISALNDRTQIDTKTIATSQGHQTPKLVKKEPTLSANSEKQCSLENDLSKDGERNGITFHENCEAESRLYDIARKLDNGDISADTAEDDRLKVILDVVKASKTNNDKSYIDIIQNFVNRGLLDKQYLYLSNDIYRSL